MRGVRLLAGGLLGLAGALPATAMVLDANATKKAAAWRTSVAKQVASYAKCVSSAALKCEKGGGSVNGECAIDVQPPQVVTASECTGAGTATSSGIPVDVTCCTGAGSGACYPAADEPAAQSDLQAAMTACNDKLDLTKKSFDFDGDGAVGDVDDLAALSCNADCDQTADGAQLVGECAVDAVADWKAATTAADGSIRGGPGTLGLIIANGCSQCSGSQCIGGESCSTSDDCLATASAIKCATNDSKGIIKLLAGYAKCQQKCEDDFKDKSGHGGGDDTNRCCLKGGTFTGSSCQAGVHPDPKMEACQDTLDGAVLPGLGAGGAGLRPLLIDTVNEATSGLYNRVDPTTGDSPALLGTGALGCGFCGDNMRDPWEECDGTDKALCGAGNCTAMSNPLVPTLEPCTCQ